MTSKEEHMLRALKLAKKGLFTASPNKSRIINRISAIKGINITKIGKIISGNKKSHIIDQKGKQILLKDKGYNHIF